jgi:phenylacetate-CoA ligase
MNTHTLKKLNKSFDFLVNNPYSSFYKDKYKKAGIKFKSIKTIEQFNSLPYLTKDELLRLSPYDFVFTNPKYISDVGITSGTTDIDNPLMLLSDIKIRPAINITRFNPLFNLNIRAHMLLYPGMTAAARLRRNEKLIRKGIINTVGDLGNLPLTAKIIKRLQIESIETTASILYLFIPYLKKEYDLNKIKVIMIGGEYCSEQKYNYLKQIFKNAHFIIDFGSVETGTMGIRCKHLDKMPIRFFHPADHTYVEILDQKEEGELVVTGLNAGKIPYLIRYKTGNHVKLTDYNCPCGKTKLMEMFGKIGHDVLRIQGTFIYSNHIHQILSSYSNYLQTEDFRLHAYEVIKKDKIMTRLVLQLIPKKQIKNLETLKEKISKDIETKLLLTPKNTLSDLIAKNIFMPLEIEFVETFPFSPKQTSIISHIV